jgi:hypothetical protein
MARAFQGQRLAALLFPPKPQSLGRFLSREGADLDGADEGIRGDARGVLESGETQGDRPEGEAA